MPHIINLQEYKDKRGSLTVLEKLLPFQIKRVYFIQDVNGRRGGHKHIITKQALICIKGECTIKVRKEKNFKNFKLNKSFKCLILEPDDWHEMYNFSKDSVLLVLASENYDVNDYIDSYD